MSFSIFFSKRARKDIKSIEKNIAKRCLKRIKQLVEEPVPKDAIKLKGMDDTYRLRVGKYRVLYKIYFEKKIIVIVKIGKRENVYHKHDSRL